MTGADKTIRVMDHDERIDINFSDVLKYHGPYMNAGAAVSFQWLRLAFGELFGEEPPDRDELFVITGHTGLGVLDALEFVTRGITRNRLKIDTTIDQGQYNPFVKGGFFFQLRHMNGRRTAHVLKPDLIPVEFFKMWVDIREGNKEEALTRKLFEMRNRLKDRVMAADPSDLFDRADLVADD